MGQSMMQKKGKMTTRRRRFATTMTLTLLNIERARCPRCKKTGGLLPGPFYDRGRVICQRCSFKFLLMRKAA
jgi:DNA-directed RNA polymerase subunit RPC12/RpoP